MAASRQSASRSAPTKPCVIAARWARSTSSASGIPRLWISRISCAAVAVGDRDGDLAVETPGPPQGRIERVGEVGRRDHDHVAAAIQPVHQREQLRDHALLHVADHLLAPWRDGVDLVEEDDARRLSRRLLENLAQVRLALAVELVDDLRSVDREEVRLRLVGDGAGDQGLAAAGRAVQQDPLGRVDAQPLEDLRVAQRQLDDLADAVQLRASGRRCLRRTTAGWIHARAGPFLALPGSDDFQLGGRVHDDRAGGRRGDDLEIGRLVAEELGPDPVARHHRQAVEQAADVLQVAFGWRDPQRLQDDALGRPWRRPAAISTVWSIAAPAFSRVTPSTCTRDCPRCSL